jgi:hypothetical protein
MPHQTFKRPDSDLKDKSMTCHGPDSGLQFFDRPGSGLAKPSSVQPIPTSLWHQEPTEGAECRDSEASINSLIYLSYIINNFFFVKLLIISLFNIKLISLLSFVKLYL